MGVVTRGDQWVVDLLDHLLMQYPTLLVTVLFGSLITTTVIPEINAWLK